VTRCTFADVVLAPILDETPVRCYGARRNPVDIAADGLVPSAAAKLSWAHRPALLIAQTVKEAVKTKTAVRGAPDERRAMAQHAKTEEFGNCLKSITDVVKDIVARCCVSTPD